MVYEFLTWEAFGPLSRMSYCLFLLHFSVMDVIFANLTYPVDFGHFLGVTYSQSTMSKGKVSAV